MATKKKELLEQEAPVSETIALEDSPVPSEDTTAPDATPVDGEDLNALLAAMDQPTARPLPMIPPVICRSLRKPKCSAMTL